MNTNYYHHRMPKNTSFLYFYFRYSAKETMIREKLIPTTDAAGHTHFSFVGITICPAYPVAYKNDLLHKYGLEKGAYRYKGVYSNQTNGDKQDDLRNIFDRITHGVDEILSWIIIRSDDEGWEDPKMYFNGTKYRQNIEITTKYWNSLGRCYSIYPKDNVVKQGIQRIEFATRIDTIIFFGHPGHFMHPDSKTKVLVGGSINNQD